MLENVSSRLLDEGGMWDWEGSCAIAGHRMRDEAQQYSAEEAYLDGTWAVLPAIRSPRWRSRTRRILLAEWGEAAETDRGDVESEFEPLVRRWHRETLHLSDSHAIARHPAYLRMIALGNRALPLILSRLRKGPDHWHVALMAITDANPVPDEAAGDMDAMRSHWLAWAKERGL